MRYLIDSNVFIEARDRYYHFDVVPGFWNWIEDQHGCGVMYSISNVFDELTRRRDDLSSWARRIPKEFFQMPDESTQDSMARLAHWAVNHDNYTDLAVQEFLQSADFVLAAHAHAHGFTVVSQEVSAPASKARVKLPDACIAVDVECILTWQWLARCKARFG